MNDEELIFLTQQNPNIIDQIDYHKNLASSSSLVLQQLTAEQQDKDGLIEEYQEELITPWSRDNMITNQLNTTFVQNETLNSPKFSVKYVRVQNENKKPAILPNPAALASKNKGPVKGLAYKEVKQRITDKTINNSLAYLSSDLEEAYLEQLNRISQDDMIQYDINPTMTKFDKKRLDYKNMMKKIRKGITKTSTSSLNSNSAAQQLLPSYPPQVQQHHHHQPVTIPPKLSKSQRTTSAYIMYNHRGNRSNLNEASSNLILNSANNKNNNNSNNISGNNNNNNKNDNSNTNNNEFNQTVSSDANFTLQNINNGIINNTTTTSNNNNNNYINISNINNQINNGDKNNFLHVKGDKIMIEYLANETPFTPLKRHRTVILEGKNNIIYHKGNNNSNSNSANATVNSNKRITRNNNERIINPNTLSNLFSSNSHNYRMKSATSVGLKSYSSSYSVVGLTGKRINPTPDLENYTNNNNNNNYHSNSNINNNNYLSSIRLNTTQQS